MNKENSRIFTEADILLPKISTKEEWEKWAVIACDQFTSEPEYWHEAEKITRGVSSALNLILPEAYLENQTDDTIKKINEKMIDYKSSILEEIPDSLIYVERTQSDGKIRRGIVGKIDLEAYDYTKEAKLPVRATEGTVLDRIPPRVKIRQAAALELPHIMLLIDNAERNIIESAAEIKNELECIYDFDLMLGGGHVSGYRLTGESKDTLLKKFDSITESLSGSSDKTDIAPVVFAVGDGNHSLAAAKAFYEQLKQTLPPDKAMNHPARYALVEVVNLHDPSLVFEPIYRVIFNCDSEDLLKNLCEYTKSDNTLSDINSQNVEYITSEKSGTVNFTKTSHTLTVGTLQNFIDIYSKSHPEIKCDYIHGEEVVKNLIKAPNSIGFIFSGMKKEELFPSVETDGALPRKTFSMGEAKDKRYYIESRSIVS